LVPLELVGADPEAGTIEYVGVINGPGYVGSKDLEKVISNKISNI
jgi:hypothetical protein